LKKIPKGPILSTSRVAASVNISSGSALRWRDFQVMHAIRENSTVTVYSDLINGYEMALLHYP
jgi:hypothetical protein